LGRMGRMGMGIDPRSNLGELDLPTTKQMTKGPQTPDEDDPRPQDGGSEDLAAVALCGPVLVPPGMYQGAFAKQNRARGLPAPPGGPPVLGSLLRSAEGLPSTRS
jgi:hypothetical protein